MKTWAKLLLGLGAAIAGIGIYGSVDALSPANVNGCQYLASPPTLSDLQTSVIQCDSSGKIQTTTTPGGTQDTNVTKLGGNAIDLGSGTGGLGTQRTILDSASPGIIPFGPAVPANSIPTVGSLSVATTGGCTAYHFTSTASTNSQAIKAGAGGTLCYINAVNTSATIAFLRTYDSAGAPTCSSATGATHDYPIPPYSVAGSAGGLVPGLGSYGEAFTAGSGYCITGAGTDTDNSNGPAGVYINAGYK